jgi:hypothetical protein
VSFLSLCNRSLHLNCIAALANIRLSQKSISDQEKKSFATLREMTHF